MSEWFKCHDVLSVLFILRLWYVHIGSILGHFTNVSTDEGPVFVIPRHINFTPVQVHKHKHVINCYKILYNVVKCWHYCCIDEYVN